MYGVKWLTWSPCGFVVVYTPAKALTSEQVQAKLAAHAAELKKQAQQTASLLNVPGYINPTVVNPHQFAMQAQKRKLLWSGKKTEVGSAIYMESR